MELGVCFDEDIFGTPQCKIAKATQIYQPKQCDSKWFFGVKDSDGSKDNFHVKKCQADWFYYKGQFREALAIYEELRTCTPSNNSSLLREMVEGTARCLMKQGKLDDALVLISEMLDSQPEDSSLWLLLSRIYEMMGNTRGEIECLQKCVTLNTWNQQVWLSLALAYERAEDLSRPSTQTLRSEAFDVRRSKDNQCDEVSVMSDVTPSSCGGDKSFDGQHKCTPAQPKATSSLKMDTSTDDVSSASNVKSVISDDEQHLTNLTSGRTCSARTSNSESLVEQVQANLILCDGSLEGTLDKKAATPSNLSTYVTKTDSCCDSDLDQCTDENEFPRFSGLLLAQQRPGLAKDKEGLRQSQCHFYSYCCLLKVKFLLEKSLEKSLSLLWSKNQGLLHKVNTKVMSHVKCQCATMRTQMQEHFTLLGVDSVSGELKDKKTNLELLCDEFEKLWFGQMMPRSSHQLAYPPASHSLSPPSALQRHGIPSPSPPEMG